MDERILCSGGLHVFRIDECPVKSVTVDAREIVIHYLGFTVKFSIFWEVEMAITTFSSAFGNTSSFGTLSNHVMPTRTKKRHKPRRSCDVLIVSLLTSLSTSATMFCTSS